MYVGEYIYYTWRKLKRNQNIQTEVFTLFKCKFNIIQKQYNKCRKIYLKSIFKKFLSIFGETSLPTDLTQGRGSTKRGLTKNGKKFGQSGRRTNGHNENYFY